MKVYNYDDTTGVYLGELEADADPLAPLDDDGMPTEWLIPAHATTIAPPEAMPNANTVFADGAWKYVEIPVEPVTPEVTAPAVEWVPPPTDLPPVQTVPAVAWVPPKALDESKNARYVPPDEMQWVPPVMPNG